VGHGTLRAWVTSGPALEAIFPPDGDPDRLLTRSDCRIVKLQRKVIVGRAMTRAGPLYVKRYNPFAWRLVLASLWQPSPAVRAWRGAQALAARGFGTPQPVAAIERRRAGLLAASFFVTREVTGALTADARWRAIVIDPDPVRRRRERRRFARALGDLFRRLHAAGIYHGDLKDANLLLRGPVEARDWVLLDLESVRVLTRVGRRRRIKNLVQLARTLGRQASATDQLRFLAAYLGSESGRAERRLWARTTQKGVRHKDRRKRGQAVLPAIPPPGPRVSCTVICQDEEATIAHCLESVAWCDEIVVVDGGSRDRTVEVARRFTERVLINPWPGYRAQKQFALEATTGEWVLNVDADERVTPELAAEVRAVLARVPPQVDGFAVPRLVCYLGRWWYHGGWYPRRIVRLVRRRAIRWGGTDPHERAEVEGAVHPLRWPLLHYTYEDVSDHLHSVNKLTTVAAAQPQPQRTIGFARLMVEPAWRFVRGYLIKRGFVDGFPGFFVAATGAFYVFLRWAKGRERGAR
jgi:hypothetical protein